MINLDAVDKCLLEILQNDSNTNIKEISARLNLTKSPIYDRIRRLEKLGLIEKHVAVLNTNLLDNYMVVYCSVSLENQKLEAIEAFSKSVDSISEVIECYLMGGANDFLLKVIVKDLQAYHKFSTGKLASLPNVAQIKSTFVLNETKRSTIIPVF